jgi:hypothetical protein
MLQVSVATTVKLLGNIVRFFMMFDHAEHQPSYDFHTKHRNCQSLEVQCMRQQGPRVQAHLLASVCYTLSSTSAQKRNKGAMLLYVEWPQQCLAGPLVPPRHRHTVQLDRPPEQRYTALAGIRNGGTERCCSMQRLAVWHHCTNFLRRLSSSYQQ